MMSLRLRDRDSIQGLKLEASETLRTNLRDTPEEFKLLAEDGVYQTLNFLGQQEQIISDPTARKKRHTFIEFPYAPTHH